MYIVTNFNYITEPIKLFSLLKSLQNDFIIKYHQILIDAYILTNSLAPYRFYDFVDQSTKLGTLTPYDVLSNFRRGATWKPHGILWFCPTVKTSCNITTCNKYHMKYSMFLNI